MRSTRLIHCIDTHVAGLGVRVVTGGVPTMPGSTMEERRRWFIDHSDDLRTFLLTEPRGHAALSGAILQPPTDPAADWGVLFIEVTGVLPMCGAGTIGVVTALVDTGMVPVTEPTTNVTLDTPIGLIAATVDVVDGKARSVTIVNVPSFVVAERSPVDVDGFGTVICDVAFGGNFYAFVDADAVGLPLESTSAEEFAAAGRAIMDAVTAQLEPRHPVTGQTDCEHTVFLAADSNAVRTRHALVNAPGWVDRSPGGTGTSARMAVLHARGELGLRTDHTNESFIGTRFVGRLIDTARVGDIDAVVPTITGSAWITGMAQYALDPDDPFPRGFTV